MTKLLTITVARKPLSESSVAKNVLKHGTGGLNIGGTRIGSAEPVTINTWDDGAKPFGGGAGHSFTGRQSTEGRWPANLILQHKSGCEQVGTKKVKSSGRTGDVGGLSHSQMNDDNWKGRPIKVQRPWQTGEGVETIDAWNCVEGCPVAGLDEQSGDRPSTGPHPSHAKIESIFRPDQGAYQKQGPLYADKGGASRFFKQVQDD